MPERYQVVTPFGSRANLDSKKIAELLAKDGQLVLPLLDLLVTAQASLDQLVDVMGRATIEAVLKMSAEQVAGLKQQGKKTDRDIFYHGEQDGRVALHERQLRVSKPRLRKKSLEGENQRSSEVEIPAYEAMQKDGRLADRMLEILISGVSTRRYADVLPEMAETVGVSKSQVSRETIEAGERLLKELAEKDISKHDILALWIDGIQLGQFHVICALGVDSQGNKHVLGFREGSTENAEIATALLTELVERGLNAKRRRLYVIDGAKALRKAIDQVFGIGMPIQRCRNHKLRNVLGHVPKDQHDQARSTFKAAWKLDAKEGKARLEQYAKWLEKQWPSAAASIKEGLDELFTVNGLDLPSDLRRCLGTTNVIDNGHSAIRERVRRVKNWQSGSMALRWVAVAFDATSQKYRKIMGYKNLYMLKATLDEPSKDRSLVEQAAAG
jgi:putative transposase